MARQRVVTRTINELVYEVLCMDVQKAEPVVKEFSLTGDKLAPEKALKELKKLYETDTFKLVVIQDTKVIECIYGMLETDFIKLARKMDSERHFVGDDTELE